MALLLRALKEGRKVFRKARLFLTGPARGGKTSLKRALMGQMFNAAEESTVAVECEMNVCVMERGQRTAWKVCMRNKLSPCSYYNLTDKQTGCSQDFKSIGWFSGKPDLVTEKKWVGL